MEQCTVRDASSDEVTVKFVESESRRTWRLLVKLLAQMRQEKKKESTSSKNTEQSNPWKPEPNKPRTDKVDDGRDLVASPQRLTNC